MGKPRPNSSRKRKSASPLAIRPSNTKSSTPRNLRTSSRVRAKFNSSSSNNNENASTKESTRAKELEEWKRKKASITRSRRVGLLGGATRIKQTGSSSRRTTTKSKTVEVELAHVV